MEEQELLKKGFNQGYKLQKNSPDLSAKIASGFEDPSHPYADGFISGAVEYIKEKGQSVEAYLEKVPRKNKDDRSLEIDL